MFQGGRPVPVLPARSETPVEYRDNGNPYLDSDSNTVETLSNLTEDGVGMLADAASETGPQQKVRLYPGYSASLTQTQTGALSQTQTGALSQTQMGALSQTQTGAMSRTHDDGVPSQTLNAAQRVPQHGNPHDVNLNFYKEETNLNPENLTGQLSQNSCSNSQQQTLPNGATTNSLKHDGLDFREYNALRHGVDFEVGRGTAEDGEESVGEVNGAWSEEEMEQVAVEEVYEEEQELEDNEEQQQQVTISTIILFGLSTHICHLVDKSSNIYLI